SPHRVRRTSAMRTRLVLFGIRIHPGIRLKYSGDDVVQCNSAILSLQLKVRLEGHLPVPDTFDGLLLCRPDRDSFSGFRFLPRYFLKTPPPHLSGKKVSCESDPINQKDDILSLLCVPPYEPQ